MVQKHPIRVKIGDFFVQCDLEKQQGTSPISHQALYITSLPYVNTNWSYSPETAKLGCDLYVFDIWS